MTATSQSSSALTLMQVRTAMAQTAKDMNSKYYKETSEAGLAVSVTLC